MLRLAQVQEGMERLLQQDPLHYSVIMFGKNNLICYHAEQKDNWKIIIPDKLLTHIVSWYHSLLNHTGQSNLEQMIKKTFYHQQLSAKVRNYVHFCPVCQKYKSQGRGYGHLPPKQTLVQPWYEVAIDTIGPWEVLIKGKQTPLYAVTIIDTVTNLTELI